MDELI